MAKLQLTELQKKHAQVQIASLAVMKLVNNMPVSTEVKVDSVLAAAGALAYNWIAAVKEPEAQKELAEMLATRFLVSAELLMKGNNEKPDTPPAAPAVSH